ncbi:MAG: L-threonylcarbamoyladenylate synthase [Chloroflexota bacterium]
MTDEARVARGSTGDDDATRDGPTPDAAADALPGSSEATRVLAGDDPAAVAEAAAAIRAGEPVAFPTETVYGLGADALDPSAVARVFELKARPRFDPIIVHLADAADLPRYAIDEDAADPRVAALADRFWPGPLTLVLRRREVVPGIVTAGLDTVALRVPSHPVALALIRAAGRPIAAPSANPFGRVSPTRAAHVVRQLDGRVRIVLDGGPCAVGIESTILLLAAGRAVLLRPGGVPVEAIEAVIGRLDLIADDAPDAAALSAGRQASHYAPGARVQLVDPWPGPGLAAAPGERVGLLAFDDPGRRAAVHAAGGSFAAIEVLSIGGDPTEAAAHLFDALHRLDAARLDRIVAQPVPEAGLGRAVMDRLRRAVARG